MMDCTAHIFPWRGTPNNIRIQMKSPPPTKKIKYSLNVSVMPLRKKKLEKKKIVQKIREERGKEGASSFVSFCLTFCICKPLHVIRPAPPKTPKSPLFTSLFF